MSSRWSSSSCVSSGTLAFLAAIWVPASRSALISERVISTSDPSPMRVGILGSNSITSVLRPDRPLARVAVSREARRSYHDGAKRCRPLVGGPPRASSYSPPRRRARHRRVRTASMSCATRGRRRRDCASRGAGGRNRTADLPLTRRLLCQLSYAGPATVYRRRRRAEQRDAGAMACAHRPPPRRPPSASPSP